MAFDALLRADRVRVDVIARSKKHALEMAAEIISDALDTLNANDVFDALVAREKLGCTSLGHGIALPHAALDGVDTGIAVALKLREPLTFDDGESVSLIIAMVIPLGDHNASSGFLQSACDALGNRPFRRQLMDADSAQELYAALAGDVPEGGVREATG